MYPNLFLETFWRPDFRPQVFVAMSFSDTYEKRFTDVIDPAVRAVSVDGVSLSPFRVDLSKTGDSILTEIIDGIAHCQMFLADVSSLGYDSKTAEPYRNGNVMYEVGLAVAARQSTEVLLIRDDKHKFLFDVSTIPHMYIDFTDPEVAQEQLRAEIESRLEARDFVADARVKLAIATLTAEEKRVLEDFARFDAGAGCGFSDSGRINFTAMTALPRLLDKRLIRVCAIGDDGRPVYKWTKLGYVVASSLSVALPTAAWNRPAAETAVEPRPAGEGA